MNRNKSIPAPWCSRNGPVKRHDIPSDARKKSKIRTLFIVISIIGTVFAFTEIAKGGWEYFGNYVCLEKTKDPDSQLKKSKENIRAPHVQGNNINMATEHLDNSSSDVSIENLNDYCDVESVSDNSFEGRRIWAWGVVPLWRESVNPPAVVLSHRPVRPGDCWTLRGSYGKLVLKFEKPLLVVRLAVEHILPDEMRSAPKAFTVQGRLSNGSHRKSFHEYKYGYAKKQFFELNIQDYIEQIIVTILSNHGNVNFTCVYRISIHGLVKE